MVELEWAVGGEELGRLACDGVVCATPSGSTAYNLSNGGPVLVWGLDAMAITFVAPHSLHARPLVVPRGRDAIVWNRTLDVAGDRARRRPPRRRSRRPAAGWSCGSARSARCSRRCPRRPSSAATADALLRSLRIENLVLIREAELEPRPG